MALRLGPWLFALAIAACLTPSAEAAEPTKALKYGEFNPAHASVDLFDGMKSGKLQVKLVVMDSTEARLIVANKADEPLNIKMPDAFAGVHVLAQLGGAAAGGGGGAQGVGGGLGGGGAGGGAGGGFFNIPAEKTATLKAPVVCLEHGKPDPQPAMTYEIRPLHEFNDHPVVRQLCILLSEGKVSQRVVQAATWHYANNLSWEELAAKRVNRLGGQSYPYFSPQEMQAAIAVAIHAEQRVKDAASPGEPKSLSEALSRSASSK